MNTTTTAKPATNIFAAAKKQPAADTKTKEKPNVIVPEAQQPGFSIKLKKLAELRKRMEADEAEAASIENDIKEVGRSVFLREYQHKKVNPGSFNLVGEEGGKFLLIVMDRYISIKEEARAAELKEWYGEDIVTTTTDYVFNNELLAKYQQEISDAISNCADIPDEDKANLITAAVKHSVAKGAIDRLMQYPEEKQMEFFYNIQPVCQLKYSSKG